MEDNNDYSNITGTSSNPSLGDDNQPSAISASWQQLQTQQDRGDFLNRLYQTQPTEPDTLTDTETILPLVTGTASLLKAPSKPSSERYMAIMRKHHITQIVEWLQKVYPLAGNPGASIYIKKILLTIQNLEDKSPNDPVLEILLTLYDALAYGGLWTTYTAEQLEKVEQILSEIPIWSVSSDDIDTAIDALDEAGLEIMPYELSLEFEEEIEDEL